MDKGRNIECKRATIRDASIHRVSSATAAAAAAAAARIWWKWNGTGGVCRTSSLLLSITSLPPLPSITQLWHFPFGRVVINTIYIRVERHRLLRACWHWRCVDLWRKRPFYCWSDENFASLCKSTQNDLKATNSCQVYWSKDSIFF